VLFIGNKLIYVRQMHGGCTVLNSYIKTFRNPRITGFSLPHTFRLLLSRILLLFLVLEPQLFVNLWPFFMIQQKNFTFSKTQAYFESICYFSHCCHKLLQLDRSIHFVKTRRIYVAANGKSERLLIFLAN
jgi:hypothetical protein